MILGNPYAVIAGLAMLAVLFAGGYGVGHRHAANDCEAGRARTQAAAIERHDQAAAAGDAVELKAARRAEKTEAVFNTIKSGEITYAQTHPAAVCGLDPDGLRLWRDANAGADAVSASELHAGMPAAAAAGERGAGELAVEPHLGGAAVPPVPGPAQGAGGLAGENE